MHTAYLDVSGKRQEASAESVLHAAKLLGSQAERIDDAREAVRAQEIRLWKRVIEPVIVVRPPRAAGFDVRIPARHAAGRLQCSLRLEDGTERHFSVSLRAAVAKRAVKVDGIEYVLKHVSLDARLPLGYHDLVIEIGGTVHRSRVIAAPLKAWWPEDRAWGAFLPLYSMRTSQSWGAGDFSDLARFRDWIGGLGGSVVSILPVLAAFLDEPFDPSPYAPVSRLFWNETYVDPRQAPELAASAPAKRLLASSAFQREIAATREAPHVDYKREYAMRRRVLEAMVGSSSRARNERYSEFRRYVAAHPSLQDYAAFRAVGEKRQAPWPDWPERMRGGRITKADYDHDAGMYHEYAQWLAEQQLAGFSSSAPRSGPGLYLDFPLGVHRLGYDTWRHREVFASGACGGAPPDAVYTLGQNWEFPPLHPEAIRTQGYQYVIDCFRHQLGHAAFLRIDHVMGLHRLYWVPRGGSARDGVYVKYRSDELYAILCLESHRHRAGLVGENLGTVPPEVNTALSRHGIRKMYVVQYEAQPHPTRPLKPAAADSVASLNTHDMPPFAAYVRGLDFQDRVDLGLLPPKLAAKERDVRRRTRRGLANFFHRRGLMASPSGSDGALTKAAMAWLAASPSSVALVNLEDLWLETESQNLPGTGVERPNWTRKARYSLDQLQADKQVIETLRTLGLIRKAGRVRKKRKPNRIG